MNGGSLDRRAFLRMGSLGVAAAAGVAFAQNPPAAPPASPVAGNVQLRTLGRTGLKITAVSLGFMTVKEAPVMQAAFNMGINYIDTARVYMGGRNERIVGEALQGYRDKVYVATKVKPGAKEEMNRSIGESIEALKLDHVDLLQLHDISKKDGVYNKEWREVLAEAKKQGKTRFIGITTHANEAEVINAVVDDPEKFFDVILVTYNFKNGQSVKPAVARAAQANVGVIAMKTQGGGYKTKEFGDASPHQAALKYVLQDPGVAAAVPAMENLQQLQENTAVMGMKLALTDADREILARYDRATAGVYCHRCGACTGSCPVGVEIPTVNRSLMYAEGYRNMELARATYAGLPKEASAAACGNCRVCTAHCIHGLDLAERMERARMVFA